MPWNNMTPVVSGQLIGVTDWNRLIENDQWLKAPTAQVLSLTSDVATTSTVMVDVTGATITLNTNGGNVSLYWWATYTGSGSGQATWRFMIDGVATAQLARLNAPPATGQTISMFWRAAGLAPGSHTFKVQHMTNGGTITMAAASVAFATFAAVEQGWS